MNTEDRTAAKLKGNNIVVKFFDGEELFLTAEDIDQDSEYWFDEISEFLNGAASSFPIANVSIARSSIKYVRLI
jgi:hypothetical protein